MSRIVYLVAYDIAAPSRLRRIARAVMAYKASGQKSVAECWMTGRERDMLARHLQDQIVVEEDKVHFFRLDPRQKPRNFGIACSFEGAPFIVL